MKTFPILYKKISTGAIQFWEISVEPQHTGSGMIVTKYGQLGTDSPQTTRDEIANGKNTGKANETTPYEQAQAEAQAKWEKQKKKGYVETQEDAICERVDALIEGGISPMLAQSYSKHAAKIKFPCYAQPKLDGHRCVAVIQNGKCTLWSRTRKRINSVPHIVKELERLCAGRTVTIDGELYNHAYKSKFEELTSFIRKEEPAEGHEIVQYHVYDVVSNLGFDERWDDLAGILLHDESSNGTIQRVPTQEIASEEDVTGAFSTATGLGYEGIMLRNADGFYANKRSYDLQKVKEFEDSVFKIIGAEEGRGKLAGHVGAFVCVTTGGVTFKVKMSGDTEKLKQYFNNQNACVGRILTVQYQGLTGTNGVPRFPVGLRFREDL